MLTDAEKKTHFYTKTNHMSTQMLDIWKTWTDRRGDSANRSSSLRKTIRTTQQLFFKISVNLGLFGGRGGGGGGRVGWGLFICFFFSFFLFVPLKRGQRQPLTLHQSLTTCHHHATSGTQSLTTVMSHSWTDFILFFILFCLSSCCLSVASLFFL